MCKEPLLVIILHLSYNNLIWYLLGSEASFILVLFRILQPEYLRQQCIKNIVRFHEVFGVQCNCPHTVYMTNKCPVPYPIFNALFFCSDIKQLLLLDLVFRQFCYADSSIALIKDIGLF